MRAIRLTLSFVYLLGLPAFAGCGEHIDDSEGPVDLEQYGELRTKQLALATGYADGKTVRFYRLSEFTPADSGWFPAYDEFPGMPVGEIFIFGDGQASGSLDGEQRPIIDRLPLEAGYSDFLEIVWVEAPAGYGANEIKSRATLLRRGLKLRRSGVVINCPVVGPETELVAHGSPSYNPRTITLWYRKKQTQCIVLEGGSALYPAGGPALAVFKTPIGASRVQLEVPAAKLYLLAANAFSGADVKRQIRVPDNDIFQYAPTAATSYSPLVALFDVTVPSDYQRGELTSHAALYPIADFEDDPRIEKRNPETFCNCPIIAVE